MIELSQQNGKLCLCVDQPHLKPLCIDFLSGKLRHRREYGGGRSQLIAKAVGIKKLAHPSVLDLTAGFGQDAFVLACLGCGVTMIERSPMMAALLEDALNRFYKDVASKDIQLSLIHADSSNYLQQLNSAPDVVYFDPMYPDTQNTALNKKEMQVLRNIVGDDSDAGDVLELALQKARHRVVVKRPRHGVVLGDRKPDVVFIGKSSRFDVYLAHRKR